MILPALVSLPAAGLLLRGSWDLWAQSIIHLVTVAGLTAWLSFRILVGYLPLPSRRNILWTACLAVLGTASVCASPIHAMAIPEWYNFLNALWMFPAMAALSKDERFYVDEAVRLSGWILMALTFYQRFSLGDQRPASALVNQNVYAGTVLMLIPLALDKKDWLLAAGLMIDLWWAKSVGAWLGLFSALALTSRWRSGRWPWMGLVGCLICLIAIYNKFESPEVLNRWEWWKTAAAMIRDRPLLGYGPGAYMYVFPAYREEGRLATLYAHQYFLQTGAEYGIGFTVLWLLGLWHCLGKSRSYKCLGAIAVLVHSLWDWPLSMPANLWLFSYYVASSLPEGSHGVNIRSRMKLPACAVVITAGFLLCSRVWNQWAAQRARVSAAAVAETGRLQDALVLAGEAATREPGSSESFLTLAGVEIRLAAQGRSGFLERACSDLETATRLNPYRSATWTELASVYDKLGRLEEAHIARERVTRKRQTRITE